MSPGELMLPAAPTQSYGGEGPLWANGEPNPGHQQPCRDSWESLEVVSGSRLSNASFSPK